VNAVPFGGTAYTHPLIVLAVRASNYTNRARSVVEASIKYREILEAFESRMNICKQQQINLVDKKIHVKNSRFTSNLCGSKGVM